MTQIGNEEAMPTIYEMPHASCSVNSCSCAQTSANMHDVALRTTASGGDATVLHNSSKTHRYGTSMCAYQSANKPSCKPRVILVDPNQCKSTNANQAPFKERKGKELHRLDQQNGQLAGTAPLGITMGQTL